MGVLADAVLARGGSITGVIPEALVRKEVVHRGVTELRIVRSMHERKAQMADLADGFVALPGGTGTLEELFEIFTWGQLGLHGKPFGLLNGEGYYDGLVGFLDHAVGEGFLRPEHRGMLFVETDPGALLDRLESYAPPETGQWIDETEV